MSRYGYKPSLCFVPVILVLSVFVLGCGGKRVKVDPNDPVQKAKAEFLEQYGFFVTADETKNGYPLLPEPIMSFDRINTQEELNRFIVNFLKIRDYDPGTPENEFEELIRKRTADIKNEIFFSDIDMAGITFGNNGGMRGDLARIYLLYGAPHLKAKLPEGNNHVDLVVWYYFDFQGRDIFRFLFYSDSRRFRVFRDHPVMPSLEVLVDPIMSPLRKISTKMANSWEDLYEIWLELEREDPEWLFRGAIIQFSYYDDVRIEEAIRAPEPAALIGARFKPTVLGQPGDLTGKQFINNPYNSFIPAKFRISNEARPSFTLSTGYADIDWEIKGDQAELSLDVRISFQNKKTKALHEFSSLIFTAKSKEEVEKKIKGVLLGGSVIPVTMQIPLDGVSNFAPAAGKDSTLSDLINGLEPGDYVVNIDVRHPLTKKSAGGIRTDIVIK